MVDAGGGAQFRKIGRIIVEEVDDLSELDDEQVDLESVLGD